MQREVLHSYQNRRNTPTNTSSFLSFILISVHLLHSAEVSDLPIVVVIHSLQVPPTGSPEFCAPGHCDTTGQGQINTA